MVLSAFWQRSEQETVGPGRQRNLPVKVLGSAAIGTFWVWHAHMSLLSCWARQRFSLCHNTLSHPPSVIFSFLPPTHHGWTLRWAQVMAPLQISASYKLAPWETARDGSNGWIPGSHGGNPDWFSSSWLQSAPSPTFAGSLGVNHWTQGLSDSLTLSLCIYLCLPNKYFKHTHAWNGKVWLERGNHMEKWGFSYAPVRKDFTSVLESNLEIHVKCCK